MLKAVLDSEEATGADIWFEYQPHTQTVSVYTVNTRRYPQDGGEYSLEWLFSPTTLEITRKDLDALRWRLRPEYLEEHIWKGEDR